MSKVAQAPDHPAVVEEGQAWTFVSREGERRFYTVEWAEGSTPDSIQKRESWVFLCPVDEKNPNRAQVSVDWLFRGPDRPISGHFWLFGHVEA